MCLMFSLSGPCELLYFFLFYCLVDLTCGECNVISMYFPCCSVMGSVCLLYCVSDSVYEMFGEKFAIFWVWLLLCCLMLWKC